MFSSIVSNDETFKIENEVLFNSEEIIKESDKVNVNKVFKCEICHSKFLVRRYLTRHLKRHDVSNKQRFKCDMCSQTFSSKTCLFRHSKLHTGDQKNFRCEICSKFFSEKANLIRHGKIHAGEKPFKCAVCLKSFSEKGNLNRHIRVHTEEKPFECEICCKTFRFRTSLAQHRQVHLGLKPFKCEVCQKAFYKRRDLHIHSRKHTKEKPYVCHVCDKAFSYVRSLQIHSKTHNSKNSKLKCEICSKFFFKEERLCNHMEMHDRLILQTCHTNFPKNNNVAQHGTSQGPIILKVDNLPNHKESHNDNLICPKTFPTNMHLQDHTKIRASQVLSIAQNHQKNVPQFKMCFKTLNNASSFVNQKLGNNPKKFSCGICRKEFVLFQRFQNHIQIHTGEKPC